MVAVALLLAGGIIAGRWAALPLGVWAVVGLAGLVCGIATLRRPGLHSLAASALATAVVAGGACLGALAYGAVPADHIAAFVPAGAAPLATVTGRIATVPQLTIAEVAEDVITAYEAAPQTRFVLAAESVSTLGGAAACEGLIGTYIKGSAWRLRVGQRVSIAGRLHRPGGPGNPGQFDSRVPARQTGMLMRLSAEADEAVEALGGEASWLKDLLWRFRAGARRRLTADTDFRGRLLLQALLFGRRDSRLGGINQAMVRAGVAHLLSISGLHLGVLVGFGYLMLRVCQVAPRRSAFFVLVLLGLYLLVVEPRAPVLRAGIMAGAFCLAGILGRWGGSANLLATAAVILLAVDPMELFRPGFQLSFGIVAGILVLYRPVRDYLFGRWIRRRGLMVFRGDQRLKRWVWHRLFRIVVQTGSVSVSAYLASVPLVAYHFGLLTPLASIATLLLFPLLAATLIVGYLQAALAPVLVNLAGALAPLLGTLADWLTGFSLVLGRYRWLSIDLQPVPIWAAALTAATIVAVAYRRRLGLSRAWACAVALGSAVVVVGATQMPAGTGGEGQLCVLDVRHGSCVALRSPTGRTVLFDAGSSSIPDPGRQVLIPFLGDSRWTGPTAAFITHANIDHYNALPALAAALGNSLPQAFVNDAFVGCADGDQRVSELLGQLASTGTRVSRLHRGQRVQIDGQTEVTVLWPPPSGTGYGSLDINESSLVLRVRCGGVCVLIPGDIEELPQRLLLELPHEELRADVLILPHHGSYTPAVEEFISAVDPKVLIRSSGRRRSGAAEKLPTLPVKDRLFTTDADGCVTVTMGRGGFKVSGYRGRQEACTVGRLSRGL